MKTPRPYEELKKEALLKRELVADAWNRSLEYYAPESEFKTFWEITKTLIGKMRIRVPAELDELLKINLN